MLRAPEKNRTPPDNNIISTENRQAPPDNIQSLHLHGYLSNEYMIGSNKYCRPPDWLNRINFQELFLSVGGFFIPIIGSP